MSLSFTDANIASVVGGVAGITWRTTQPTYAAPGDAWLEQLPVTIAGRDYYLPAVVVVSSRIGGDTTYLQPTITALQAAWPDDSTLTTPAVADLRIRDGAGSWQAWRIEFTGGEVQR